MNKELIAIKILHNSNNRIVFNLYAELFRLIGIYVGEGTILGYSEEEASRDLNEFQLFLGIYAGNEPHFSKYNIVADKYVWIDSNKEIYSQLTLENIPRSLEEEMKNVLGALQEKESFAELSILKEDYLQIYLDCNILKGACLLQFYRLKDKVNKQAEDIFDEAITALEGKKEQINSEDMLRQKYFAYAYLYCRQKVNLACFYQPDCIMKYKVKQLYSECMDLIERFPDFSNLYVLMGMICENTYDTKIDAMNGYRAAAKLIGEKSYASHIYYWLGVLFQWYSSATLKIAQNAYEISYKLKPKYRNEYKIGSVYSKMAQFEDAIEWFDICVQNIEKQKASLDPLEVEYYYKTNTFICWIYVMDLQQYGEGIKYGEAALKFYREELENNKNGYFEYYFGKEQEAEYREISKKRINTEKLYRALAIAYRETGNAEESEKCWKMVTPEAI